MGTKCLTWDIRELAKALKIKEGDVKLYFTDGRRVSFLIERRIAYEIMRGTIAGSEGAGYDVIDKEGNKWEVRSISKDGVYFCPSYMVGSGRAFEEVGFLNKMEKIKGYILSDITQFPDIPFWIVPKELVQGWWNEEKLGKNCKISRTKALQLLEQIKSR
ncbi:MAG: hypothetical protein KJ955_04500 [Nanoarchaeota archaeon]|nr:hypothetical protein [Nanoarchaeota archaeon]